MSKVIKLRKGLDIKIAGKAEPTIKTASDPDAYAIKPTDFHGLTPKLSVKAGEEVRTGEPLFYDKYNPAILFTSPVGGTVVSINRGDRRRILEIIIQPNGDAESLAFSKANPLDLSPEDVKAQILKSGLWPFLKRRPYGIIANPNEAPKAIFISAFDTAPLAPDYNLIVAGQESTLQTGINALSKLTKGKVYIGLAANGKSKNFEGLKNVEKNWFDGPHPAGNVGIQIHHIAPLNKGDIVWTINPQDILFIGRLFETGKLDFSKIIGLAGSEVEKPCYYKTKLGATISSLVEGKLKKKGNVRIISGNVLTGTKVSKDNFLGFYDSLVTVIPEGDKYEFLGWATPGLNKFSAGKTFLSSLFPKKEYILDTNMHGGERAFVLNGQYEKYLPMDILPVHLLKAILVNDIDKMEQLGIYEVVEEDLALCEYACTSKIKVQEILRNGINSMIKEFG
ncbi:Na(+)-translocating NADH-quinone reductase subunit A [hydrothermal vent metagenome]|uniref:Na(+)-translocating NADH-quinone reductase subunit A n=1 Tax=hydrothermal vent metagenome TaxID=652676 RepID=A0A3B0UK67_9ZZZZ